MDNEVKLAAGAMVALSLATAALVGMPYIQVRDIKPLPGLKTYTSEQLRGRQVYIANGCVYCHTQQPRDRNFGPDFERGWGRASVPADYVYDRPHLLGSMRTGPTPRRQTNSTGAPCNHDQVTNGVRASPSLARNRKRCWARLRATSTPSANAARSAPVGTTNEAPRVGALTRSCSTWTA